VVVDGFWMDEHPVTNAEFRRVIFSEAVQAYEATPSIWESTQKAYAHATTWLVERKPGSTPEQATQGNASPGDERSREA